MNKVGDLFLLSGISIAIAVLHSSDFSVLAALVGLCPEKIVEVVSLFLFIGAVGKSAQVGLHT